MQNVRSEAITQAAPPRRRPSARVRRRRVLVATLVFLALMGGLVPALFAFDDQAPVQRRVHVVSVGDTLWSLASRYEPEGDPRRFVHEVQLLNDLEHVQVFPGQRLTLPPA